MRFSCVFDDKLNFHKIKFQKYVLGVMDVWLSDNDFDLRFSLVQGKSETNNKHFDSIVQSAIKFVQKLVKKQNLTFESFWNWNWEINSLDNDRLIVFFGNARQKSSFVFGKGKYKFSELLVSDFSNNRVREYYKYTIRINEIKNLSSCTESIFEKSVINKEMDSFISFLKSFVQERFLIDVSGRYEVNIGSKSTVDDAIEEILEKLEEKGSIVVTAIHSAIENLVVAISMLSNENIFEITRYEFKKLSGKKGLLMVHMRKKYVSE